MEVIFDSGKVAKIEARSEEQTHPQECPDDAKHKEFRKAHAANTRNKRCEGAKDWQEARQQHRFATVLTIELLSLLQIFWI